MRASLKSWVKTWVKSTAIVILALVTVAAHAQPGKGNGNANNGNRGKAATSATISVNIGISAGEARSIARELGLTGYDHLPPGIAKNVGRGKPLPPGIARKVPPQNMLARLPQVEDHEWRVSGADLILVALGTAIVVEVLEAVFD